MESAKIAKRTNRSNGMLFWRLYNVIELIRILHSISIYDNAILRQYVTNSYLVKIQAIALHLRKLKYILCSYLDQTDFLLCVRDATALIDEFGLYKIYFFFIFRKPEQADDLMDKVRDIYDHIREVDTSVKDYSEDWFNNINIDYIEEELEQSIKDDMKNASKKKNNLPDSSKATGVK